MQLTIRDAQPSDARRFEEIRVGGWKTAYAHIIDPSVLETLQVTEERIALWRERIAEAGPHDVTLTAELDDEVVGLAVLRPSRDDDVPEAAELLALYIDPVRRSGGVGTALMTAGFARMPHEVQTLWTLEGNAAARRFYERHGFVADGASKPLDVVGQPTEIRYRRTRLG